MDGALLCAHQVDVLLARDLAEVEAAAPGGGGFAVVIGLARLLAWPDHLGSIQGFGVLIWILGWFERRR